MDVAGQVRRFYDELWNKRDLDVAEEILDAAVTFRGSLGSVVVGPKAVCDYVTTVTTALSGYRCDLEVLVAEGNSAAARLTFSGTQVGEFLGRAPTGKSVRWAGAAFFRTNGAALVDIWVLGDLVGLYAQLEN